MHSVRIGTWNINSIRVRLEMLKEVIERNNLDILLLQEIKCCDDVFPLSYIQSLGINCVFTGQKSYNGVAILSKYPIEVVMKELPMIELAIEDNEKRYIEGIISVKGKIIRVASVYVPQGASVLHFGETLEDSERFKYKLNFLNRLKARIEEIKKETNNFIDEYVIIAGDFNVAQDEIDLHNPKLNDGKICFHPLERELLRGIKKIGLEDSFRKKHPETKQYTWWDYKTRGFDRDVGWRLDYMLSSRNIIDNMKDIYVDIKTRAKPKTSDHAPSVLEFII